MASIPEDAQRQARGYEGFAGFAAEVSSQSVPAWPPPTRAPQDAPNVVLMLVDDMGFSDIGPFGGEISTPHLDRLAEVGYRFTNYHTPPVCSPARAGLLTGLNPHRVGFASVAHADPGYPGYALQLADDVPTIAESFRASGYGTFMVGKWHLTKESLLHDAADKSSWPLQRGFDRYFGSMDGFTTLFQPHRLISDNSPVTCDAYPDDYYVTDDLTDRALGMINGLRANDPNKPFFLYFAHHAVHGPLQAKREDAEKYRGQYEAGWDHIREERFRRQIDEGLFDAGIRPAPRNTEPGEDVEAWDSLSQQQQALFARYMQVYAAAVDNIDQNLGRLITHLRRIGEYENTIMAFTSDNGGSGEGGPVGTRSYFSQFVHRTDLPARWRRDVERGPELIGGPRAFAHYPRGWAYASNTPFRLYKGHTFAGGIHAPLLMSWPHGLDREHTDPGVRSQFSYVTDLGLTLLELAGVDHLSERAGLPAKTVDGIGFGAVLRDAGHQPLRREQYSEFVGRRAYFCDNWKIVTLHPVGTPYSDQEWELYDLTTDPAETRNLAADQPDKVAELADQWRAAAWHNTVYPLPDDESLSTVRPSTELLLEQPVTLYPGTPTLERYRSSKLTMLRSFDVQARFTYRSGDAGVLVSHGDQGGGYVLFVENAHLCFSYNEYGTMHRIAAPLDREGSLEARLAFLAGRDIDWRIELSLDGRPMTMTALDTVLQLIGMSPFTGISVGADRGSPVDWPLFERHRAFKFSGEDLSVAYVPGKKATYNHEIIKQVEREVDRIYE
jgi:arylsulfatase